MHRESKAFEPIQKRTGNVKFYNIFFVSILLLCGSLLRAQSDQYFVEVELSNPSPLISEQITVSYKLRYRGNNISLMNPSFDVQAPDFGDAFQVLRQGRSGGMDLDFSGSITVFQYAYILKPLKTGTFTVGPATIQFNQERYTSKSLSIKVLPADAPPDLAQADNIFIDASLSKANPYKGEELILSYKLYSRYELLGIEEQTPPTIDGFSANLLNRDQQVRVKVEKINGQDFYTLDLYRAELYPLRSGDFRLDPFQMSVVANVPTGRRVRDFWGNRLEVRRESVRLNSPAVRINVRDLPEAGKPANFNGAVGSYQLKTDLSSRETSTGEPLTYRIQISGQGNLKLIGDPKLNLPPGFEAYDPKTHIGSTGKSYEYLIIPGKPGEFTLDPYSFSYFDPKAERYVNLSTEPYVIQVAPGEGGMIQSGSTAGLTKEEVEKLGEDIRYLQTTTPAFSRRSRPQMGGLIFFIGIGAPLVLAIPVFLLARKQREKQADLMGQRNRRARRAAEKRLRQARVLADKGEHKAFYNELIRAVWGYLGDKFGIAQSDMSRDAIRHTLNERGVKEGSTNELIALLDRAEMALYAPVSSNAVAGECELAVRLLSDLEASITNKML